MYRCVNYIFYGLYQREVNILKNKNENNKNTNNQSNDSENSDGYIKRYVSTIKSLIHNEFNKDSDERSRDFKALILTILIISILLFIVWKVPFLHNLIFP